MRGIAQKFMVSALSVTTPMLAHAQDGPGALMPHPGAQITTAFSNRFGPDAESTVKFVTVTPQQVNLVYTSTRGLVAQRTLNAADRASSRTYVLGYAPNMPQTIPQTTSLGLSGTSLVELRTKGKTALSLIYDANLSEIDGELTLVEKDVWVPVLVEGIVTKAPAVHATGKFQTGEKLGSGDFYFLNNQSNRLTSAGDPNRRDGPKPFDRRGVAVPSTPITRQHKQRTTAYRAPALFQNSSLVIFSRECGR